MLAKRIHVFTHMYSNKFIHQFICFSTAPVPHLLPCLPLSTALPLLRGANHPGDRTLNNQTLPAPNAVQPLASYRTPSAHSTSLRGRTARQMSDRAQLANRGSVNGLLRPPPFPSVLEAARDLLARRRPLGDVSRPIGHSSTDGAATEEFKDVGGALKGKEPEIGSGGRECDGGEGDKGAPVGGTLGMTGVQGLISWVSLVKLLNDQIQGSMLWRCRRAAAVDGQQEGNRGEVNTEGECMIIDNKILRTCFLNPVQWKALGVLSYVKSRYTSCRGGHGGKSLILSNLLVSLVDVGEHGRVLSWEFLDLPTPQILRCAHKMHSPIHWTTLFGYEYYDHSTLSASQCGQKNSDTPRQSPLVATRHHPVTPRGCQSSLSCSPSASSVPVSSGYSDVSPLCLHAEHSPTGENNCRNSHDKSGAYSEAVRPSFSQVLDTLQLEPFSHGTGLVLYGPATLSVLQVRKRH
eukprot:GHVQ01043036.1.p1 GENE.GHVQ01043036.1~~GHVQ01043036.1.p1  ORF type:complete len:463 (-),score=43.63 GHVQ01043036.1:483-1871(-)